MTNQKNYLFTSESVSEGHPDKVADQISDAILDEFLARDPQSKVACETLVTTGHVTIAGEVKSKAYVDLMETVRGVIDRIGYNRSSLKFEAESCGILSALHEQSADINRGVERENEEDQGAGDQGMMFGYACDETDSYMPLPLDLSHRLLRELAEIRRNEDAMTYVDANGHLRTYLRPDSKSQVTVEYTPDGQPVRVHTIVISTQHDEFILPNEELSQAEADRRMVEVIERDVREVLIPRVKATLPEKVAAMIDDDVILHVNPTGKFVIGGPHG
ncbi:MAG: methionine adenosyltransferase, partial [Paramuribaculum sp.]|nr:methionine adenosyltransferase [Paramuribaculum sp.]